MEHLFEKYYECSGVCTDTRNIDKDSLFICLKGANFNGNTFANEALAKGAKYVIADEAIYTEDPNIFFVEDALLFLQQLARYHRLKFDIPVIGITGSNGKTSTKELIYSVLSQKYSVLATIGNLNNHIGVPLTLLRLNEEHDMAIIEMGANKFKDIEELCGITEPNYGIITNIGKAHLEGFGDFEGVLKTKRELYESVEKNRGRIIVNADDEVLMDTYPKGILRTFYGTGDGVDISGQLVSLTPFVTMTWSKLGYTSPTLTTQMIGKYNFYNYLAAVTFGYLFELDNDQINKGITEYVPTNNRSQVLKTSSNTLIMDCYNANPTSMKSALESFAMNKHDDKLFIIGDMLELGTESKKEHQEIINLAASLNLTGILVGNEFSNTNHSFIHFATRDELIDFILTTPIKDNLILLKGSRGIGLEKVKDVL